MRKLYWLETYGCQMNFAESNSLEAMLEGIGYAKAQRAEDADAVILNTCSVRKSAEDRIWGRLGYFHHLKTQRPLKLILTGCMAQRTGDSILKQAPYIDAVVLSNDKLSIARLLQDGDYDRRDCYGFAASSYKKGDFSSYVAIMNGCNNFCSYCIVPYVRGREVSRSVEDILAEVHYLDAQGVREITLLGQNVNSYDCDGIGFAELLGKCCQNLSSIRIIRFESPHPKDFSNALIETLKDNPVCARHFHIPLQSGSDRILQAMNRHYTSQAYLDLLDRIKAAMPDATFSSDVMVGFPTETEEDYQKTLDVMEKAGFLEAFMYYYNPRELTKAASLEGQVSQPDKDRRLSNLIDLQLKRAFRLKSQRTGLVWPVLVTQVSRDDSTEVLARNEHNEMVAFKASLKPGDMAMVRYDSLKGNTFKGTLL